MTKEEVCKEFGIENIGDFSDGFHTFNELYHQRAVLFAAIVKQNKSLAWKSHKHEDGELCFGGGWFIVGVDTPEGSYTYHYEDKYWDMFDCQELQCGKHWDGHTDKDVTRLLSLAKDPLVLHCDASLSKEKIDSIKECLLRSRMEPYWEMDKLTY